MPQDPKSHDKAYWQQKLTPEEYHVCREGGTEPPHSGEYIAESRPGSWLCKCCDAVLFDGTQKFASSCGWPAFSNSHESRITELEDHTHGMMRTEVRCKECDSHLGHVFNDGPPPSGLRYCINSLSLKFRLGGE